MPGGGMEAQGRCLGSAPPLTVPGLLLSEWLCKCLVQRLVVVISSIESNEVLERWQFDIECDKTAKDET